MPIPVLLLFLKGFPDFRSTISRNRPRLAALVTDRQTDRLTDGQTGGQTDRQAGRRTDGQTDEQTDKINRKAKQNKQESKTKFRACLYPSLSRSGQARQKFLGGV